jgi:hypothetical protein
MNHYTQPTLTSVIGCSNALGTTLPPYYILQSDEIVSDVIAQSPPGTQATFANSGPKDCSIVREWIIFQSNVYFIQDINKFWSFKKLVLVKNFI